MYTCTHNQDDKTATLDITTNDYTSSSNFPKPFSDLTEDVNTLKTLFNSSARLADLITAYKVQIIQKLLPGLTKAGYSEASSTDNGNNGGTAPPPPPAGGPSVPRGGGGVPLRPDNEIDPGRIGAPPQFPRAGLGQNPLEIGRSDLDPLGGQVGRLPGAGGDGMFVGPNHPLFGREQGQVNPLGGAPQRGPWGGDGFLPPLGAPPGARFDPITPFGQGGGVGGGIGGQPGRNWGDEMPPPVSLVLFVCLESIYDYSKLILLPFVRHDRALTMIQMQAISILSTQEAVVVSVGQGYVEYHYRSLYLRVASSFHVH